LISEEKLRLLDVGGGENIIIWLIQRRQYGKKY
jgi:23S rRNA A1618 N6-methylase RlmF